MAGERALVFMDDGIAYIMDVVQHEGGLWLVPEWLVGNSRTHRLPRRMVSLAGCLVRHTPEGPAEWTVSDAIPKSIFDGSAPPSERQRYDVHELPDLAFRIPK
mgnify:CR=1 FL=1